MRIALNLATRPFADLGPALKRLRVAMGVLALVCVLLLVGLYLFDKRAEAARAREHGLDLQIARLQNERQTNEAFMRQPANAQLLNQVEDLNQLVDQKAFSWTLAMENLETVLPGGVQVTSIEPIRDKEGKITVHLRVVGPRDRAVDLVRNLEHSRRFLLPRIVGENAESSSGPNQRQEPVSASNRFEFDLFADYNPPTHEEQLTLRTVPSSEKGAGAEAKMTHAPAHATPTQPAGRPPYTGGAMPPRHPGGPQ